MLLPANTVLLLVLSTNTVILLVLLTNTVILLVLHTDYHLIAPTASLDDLLLLPDHKHSTTFFGFYVAKTPVSPAFIGSSLIGKAGLRAMVQTLQKYVPKAIVACNRWEKQCYDPTRPLHPCCDAIAPRPTNTNLIGP